MSIEEALPAGTDSGHIRERALSLILREAQKAASENDMDRFDSLISRLPLDSEASGEVMISGELREARLDVARLTMAALLVLGLIAIVAYAIGSDSEVASQYVPLVSGLAGIAIGWLYGASGRRRGQSDIEA